MHRIVKFGILLAILASVGLMAGVSRMRAAPAEDRVLTVKPGELFVGDLKRVESLFDASAGCLELDPPDGEFFIYVADQIWADGARLDHGDSWSGSLVEKPSLLVLSFTGFETGGKQTLMRYSHGFLTQSGGGTGGRGSRSEDLPRKRGDADGRRVTTHSYTAKRGKPMKLKAGEKTMVYAFCEKDSFDGRFQHPGNDMSVEDQVKQSTRAFAVVVWWKEVKDAD